MIRLPVDLTNPGQFFACCGLFELAQRLDPATRGHFEAGTFVISHGELKALVGEAAHASLISLDDADASASPLSLGAPFNLRLDWWKDRAGGGAGMKPWAGSMQVHRIAQAMRASLEQALASGNIFDCGFVVLGADGKKVEPFWFDARRGASALPLDVGFSTDSLFLKTVAFPATEFFTLIGLQRFRPQIEKPRVFRYWAWTQPSSARLAALTVAGAIPNTDQVFQFGNSFRTDYSSAFSPAVPVNGDRHE